MRFGIRAFALVATLAAYSTANGSTLIYLSPEGLGGSPVPGLPEIDISGGGSGQLHIWVDTTDHLSGVSLDVFETGGAISFTGSAVAQGMSTGGNRWSFTGDGTVAGDGSSISSMEGGAFVGLGAAGIGPPTEGDDFAFQAGAGFHFGTIDYDVLDPLGSSDVSLRVGGNIIGFQTGDGPIRFGDESRDPVENVAGSSDLAAQLLGDPVDEVLSISPESVDIPFAVPAQLITQQFTALLNGDETEAEWSIVSSRKDGVETDPFNPASLDPTSGATTTFSWLPHLSDLNPGGADAVWAFDVQASTNPEALATLTVNLVIPEPSSLALVGLAMVGLVGFAGRRRS